MAAIAPEISIVIPTQRRPGPLARAVRSAFAQEGVDTSTVELVVADNDAVASARLQVESLAREAPFPVRYVHEPSPGVANVRNAALAIAEGRLIAFLDDDEEAPPGWLAALVAVQRQFDADAVFGPVRTKTDEPLSAHRDYLERFFARQGPAETGAIDHYYGCGDSLVRRAALPGGGAPFSAIRNHIGGEDDLLFGAMEKAGARFAWAADAWVWEYPAPERLSLRYTIRRAFAYGQGATAHSAAAGDRFGVVRWMVLGVFQALAFGLLAVLKFAMRAPDRAFTLDRAARGLGKTLWWGPFKIRFYGLAAPAPAEATLVAGPTGSGGGVRPGRFRSGRGRPESREAPRPEPG